MAQSDYQSFEDKLSDPEHKNWLKAVWVLKELKTGLQSFVVENLDTIHADVTQHVKQNLLPYQTGISPCFCIIGNHCNTCERFKEKLEEYGKPKMIEGILQSWKESSWEIGKCFLGRTRRIPENPDSADAAALISIIINCSGIHKNLTENMSEKHNNFCEVRDFRNEVMHSPDLKLEDEELQELLQYCYQILRDDAALKRNPDAQTAKQKICEIEHQSLSVHSTDYKSLYEDVAQEIKSNIQSMNSVVTNIQAIQRDIKLRLQCTCHCKCCKTGFTSCKYIPYVDDCRRCREEVRRHQAECDEHKQFCSSPSGLSADCRAHVEECKRHEIDFLAHGHIGAIFNQGCRPQ